MPADKAAESKYETSSLKTKLDAAQAKIAELKKTVESKGGEESNTYGYLKKFEKLIEVQQKVMPMYNDGKKPSPDDLAIAAVLVVGVFKAKSFKKWVQEELPATKVGQRLELQATMQRAKGKEGFLRENETKASVQPRQVFSEFVEKITAKDAFDLITELCPGERFLNEADIVPPSKPASLPATPMMSAQPSSTLNSQSSSMVTSLDKFRNIQASLEDYLKYLKSELNQASQGSKRYARLENKCTQLDTLLLPTRGRIEASDLPFFQNRLKSKERDLGPDPEESQMWQKIKDQLGDSADSGARENEPKMDEEELFEKFRALKVSLIEYQVQLESELNQASRGSERHTRLINKKETLEGLLVTLPKGRIEEEDLKTLQDVLKNKELVLGPDHGESEKWQKIKDQLGDSADSGARGNGPISVEQEYKANYDGKLRGAQPSSEDKAPELMSKVGLGNK